MAETKNLRIAIGICERALAAAPENPEPVIILAEAYLDADLSSEAAEAYRFALSIDDQSGKAHFGLGKLYLKTSRLEEARPHLEAALESGQQDPAIFNALGVLEDQSGDHASAQSFYQAGLALDPDNTALTNNLGVSLLLSKPSEIGDSIFGRLAPEQESRQTAAVPRQAVEAPRQTSIAAKASASVSLKAEPEQKSGSTLKVRDLTQAELFQVEEDTLFTFFRDSRVADLGSLEPVVTPAPIEIVDFQALPVLPDPTGTHSPSGPMVGNADTNNSTSATLLARALVDYNPGSPAVTDQPERAHAPLTTQVVKIVSHRAQSFDLARVRPVRKPFVPNAAVELASEQGHLADFVELEVDPEPKLQLAKVAHLPIEMPALDRVPPSEGKNSPSSDRAPEAGSTSPGVLPNSVQIVEISAPASEKAVTTLGDDSEIMMDMLLPTDTGILNLHGDGPTLKAETRHQPSVDTIAALPDASETPHQPDPQEPANPGSGEPDAEPVFWPNGLAERSLPSLRSSSPDDSQETITALMLLNRDPISSA
ncbi:tetratricopeptide repeat protein [Denitrobaculum tricleocarpae]|nr:tetratricopeptide repeat protein [Denitrobaculum tricleocarpae]